MFTGEQRIKKIKFTGINGGIFVAGKKRRDSQRLLGFYFFGIKKRADGFGALPVFENQFKLVKKKSSRNSILSEGWQRRKKNNNDGAMPAETFF
jgi:hypothetical protein